MRRRWLSGRAIIAHLALAVSVPVCLAAAWWQVRRAQSGNLLSYGYAVEWPVFAVLAFILWWQLIHYEPADVSDDSGIHVEPSAEGGGRRWGTEDESPAMRAYNDDLAVLAARGGSKTWRNPRGLP